MIDGAVSVSDGPGVWRSNMAVGYYCQLFGTVRSPSLRVLFPPSSSSIPHLLAFSYFYYSPAFPLSTQHVLALRSIIASSGSPHPPSPFRYTISERRILGIFCASLLVSPSGLCLCCFFFCSLHFVSWSILHLGLFMMTVDLDSGNYMF